MTIYRIARPEYTDQHTAIQRLTTAAIPLSFTELGKSVRPRFGPANIHWTNPIMAGRHNFDRAVHGLMTRPSVGLPTPLPLYCNTQVSIITGLTSVQPGACSTLTSAGVA